ncbi:MAG: hypothetical protein ACYTF9_03515 [Planctomycetota bacterium]|jgi:hypothetical protein
MHEIAEAIQQMPSRSWVPILVVTAIGIVLWAAGGRLLRTAFALLGFVFGAAVGWFLGHAVELGAPVGIIALVAALLLACVGTLAYRTAVAAGLAAVLAIAAPLAVWSVADLKGLEAAVSGPLGTPEPVLTAPVEPDPAADDPDPIDTWLAEIRGQGAESAGISEEVVDSLEAATTLAEQIVEQAGVVWEKIPESIRGQMIGATVVGGLIGFLVGTLATAFSATLVTAFAGSVTWMAGGWSAMSKAGVDGPWAPATPAAWLVLWFALALIGLAVQWTVRAKAADKPS